MRVPPRLPRRDRSRPEYACRPFAAPGSSRPEAAAPRSEPTTDPATPDSPLGRPGDTIVDEFDYHLW